MKTGDKVVCIRECRMEKNWDDKRTTIGKVYTIMKSRHYEGEQYIIDDKGEDHYFTDVWNTFFRPVRKEKLLKLKSLSEK